MAVILQWNLDGYHRRSSELRQLIRQYQPIIIALQETHLRPNQNISHSKYNIFRYDHLNTAHNHACGGTAIMVSKSYSSHPLTLSSNLQHVALKINIPELHPLPITVCSIYIPPSHNTCAHDILPLSLSPIPSFSVVTSTHIVPLGVSSLIHHFKPTLEETSSTKP